MSATATKSKGATAIRAFQVDVPEEALEDLRRRIEATNWPEKETVADHSQGVPLAMTQELALLGDGLRLAQGRGQAEGATALHDRD